MSNERDIIYKGAGSLVEVGINKKRILCKTIKERLLLVGHFHKQNNMDL